MIRPPTHNRITAAAFTLIEVMVSIAILSVIVLSLGRIFTTVTTATTRAQNTVLLDQTARRLFDSIQHDLSQAYVRTNMPFHVHSSGAYDTLAFVTASRVGLAGSSNYNAIAEARDSHAVAYSLTQDPNSGIDYIERASPLLLNNGTASDAARLFHDASSFYNNSNTLPMNNLATNALTSALDPAEDLDASTRNTAGGTQVVVLSATFRINGLGTPDTNHEFNVNQLPDPTNPPRFIDVDLALITKRDWDLYTLLNNNNAITPQNDPRKQGLRHYSRRFPLNTRPVEALF